MHTHAVCRRGFYYYCKDTAALAIYRVKSFLVKCQFLRASSCVFDTARKYTCTFTHMRVKIMYIKHEFDFHS